jgi:hypothetical protein
MQHLLSARTSTVAAALAVMLASQAQAFSPRANIDPNDSTSECVRSSERWIVNLVQDGRRNSPAFEQLVRALTATDVIVYIASGRPTNDLHQGRLLQRTTTGAGRRYLWIVVAAPRDRVRVIGLLAHELQHALEVAQTPDVRTGDQIQQLFEHIGFHCPGACFETHAAVTMQRLVVEELLATDRASK